MIVSVASGKGGTGKTTVSTNLVAAHGEDIVYLDCDVEEPNGHIFLKPSINASYVVHTLIPQVDHDSCDLCGKCSDICRFSAITQVGRTVLVFPELCHSCGGCMEVCPQNAVSDGKREIGKVEIGLSDKVHFHHGVLRIGEPMSPPLIKAVKKNSIPGLDTVIDAPPGTSCPVITAVYESDFVILVTEPTPFGLHDLILAYETVKELKIPCGLVINKADLGDDNVQKFAEDNGIPILLSIPFDRDIAQLYSRGLLLAEADASYRKMFQDLFTSVKEKAVNFRSKHERVCHT